MFTLNQYTTADQLTTDLAQHIIRQLEQGIAARGYASLAVSGGKTPIPLFQYLSQQNIAWHKVQITLVDDRWVDEEDDASNEKLVKRYLLQGRAQTAHFVGLKNSAPDPFSGAEQTNLTLANFPRPFDVVILGMGEDGHTASLFPHAENLSHALDLHSGKLVVGMTPLTAPLMRITLTLPAILASRAIYLHLVGESKKVVLQQAELANDITAMPIRAILQQSNVPVTGFWTA